MIIRISRLRLRLRIGVTDTEREEAQEVVLSISVQIGDREMSDSLADTLDYRELTHRLKETLEHQPCVLLETLGRKAVAAIMSDSRVKATTVELTKLRSIRFVDSVSVVIEGRRHSKSDKWDFA
jgi:FolB domain-containing protein